MNVVVYPLNCPGPQQMTIRLYLPSTMSIRFRVYLRNGEGTIKSKMKFAESAAYKETMGDQRLKGRNFSLSKFLSIRSNKILYPGFRCFYDIRFQISD